MNLKDKIIVITGASDGIGKEIALKLAKENAQLALIARNENKLNEVKNEAEIVGATNVKIYSCNIRNTNNLETTIKSIISDFETVDILINNAGIWQKKMQIDQISQDTIEAVIETNLSALIHTSRLLIPTLGTRDSAAIINVVSKSGVVAENLQSAYTASKYGARGFTEVLKVDLKDSNIKVAGVYQAGTKTKMFEKANENVSLEKFMESSDLADVITYMLNGLGKIWLHDVRVEK